MRISAESMLVEGMGGIDDRPFEKHPISSSIDGCCGHIEMH